MNNIYSIYNKLIIKEVTYEMGDNRVTAICELILPNETIETTFIITHTDLNRIMAKISALGFEFQTEQVSAIQFDDGTKFIEYKFDNVFGEKIVLENFAFANTIQELRA